MSSPSPKIHRTEPCEQWAAIEGEMWLYRDGACLPTCCNCALALTVLCPEMKEASKGL